MPIRPFEAQVRREQPRAVILDLRGEIDASAEDALNAVYAEAEAARPDAIVLNFTDVDYINSTGIALVVGLLARARKQHIPLRACGLSEHYQEIFTITRLADFMGMYDNERAALQDGHEPGAKTAETR
ncbi:MAG TPA: STAS domain-containing protein [Ktedonobacterales bacterium]